LFYLFLGLFGLDFRWKMIVTIIVVFSIRQLAIHYDWKLPTIK
jgi:uncharacterized membrane protein YeiH